NQAQKRDQVAVQLANARVDLSNLRSAGVGANRALPNDEVAKLRNDLFKKVDDAAQEVLNAGPDAARTAQARNILGDAYLQMATFAPAAGATSRPESAS